ncbi:ribulokinase [Fimbriimonas ginsengisoli]|uniref:L-ribulokinase n=1 Tax=Fimbriimonas ginsengisoli Gsoil 348 TaxID=661478 RepID=A0A068NPD9_FIMGI|nr:ribulokinase [Fimbriimonas ginsengisoli]AIE85428.1 L-ribulokinase [Fimbriimonas ginsengisoli Gsoil 348]
MARLSLGLDYGTNSVRALLVDVETGAELATSVFNFPSGDAGILLDRRDPNLARQNPADYVAGFYAAVAEVLKGVNPHDVVGIGVDTTGSSPLPIDAEGTPLAFHPEFKENLAAYCWLWKDHTSHAEAAEITEKARAQGQPYLAKCGGTYSSEWFWSKILHCARVAPEVFAAADSWAECCDWITGYLTGSSDPKTMARSVCAAGHKAMYAEEWGGLPSKQFLSTLDPRLADLRDRLYDKAVTSDQSAGGLSAEVAERTGLKEGTPVAVGAFDAHFGAVASGARPGVLVKIMGTSTCDCMVHPLDEPLADVPGLCGIVRGSVLPGCYGLEAGQSAVGDIFNWFSRFSGRSHEELTDDAEKLKPGEAGLLALDWNNGNRTILVDPLLTGLLVGQTLYTTPAEVYRTLIEATAFGALKIINRLEEYGVAVREVVNCGGIAEKSSLTMQIYADVCNRPMKVSRSSQTCALGSAIFGAVVGGAYGTVEEAQAKMTGVKDRVYEPNPQSAAIYARLFKLYSELHDAFGNTGWTGSLSHVMKDLIDIRDEVRAG